jgi:hypothetical protein
MHRTVCTAALNPSFATHVASATSPPVRLPRATSPAATGTEGCTSRVASNQGRTIVSTEFLDDDAAVRVTSRLRAVADTYGADAARGND